MELYITFMNLSSVLYIRENCKHFRENSITIISDSCFLCETGIFIPLNISKEHKLLFLIFCSVSRKTLVCKLIGYPSQWH